MNFLRPMGNAIIQALHLRETDEVLDIAAGTGEPGLTLAKIVSHGKVVSTDLAEQMIATAKERAADLGLRNFETQVADVSALPFASESFDASSCRMGFMFFPNMQAAAAEIARVLKKGGRFATSVWDGPEENPWVATMMSPLARNLNLPPPSPELPGMFRCARPGLVADLLRAAGFNQIEESELTGTVNYESPDHYWNNMMELAAPVVSAMSKADATTAAKIKGQVYTALHERATAKGVSFNFGARIISAQK